MINTLTHIAFPRHSNNFKAKLLQFEGITILVLVVLLFQSVLNFTEISKVAVLGYAANISTNEVIRITNQKRADLGLNELEYSSTLAKAAHEKGLDMIENDYWAHVSPSGVEPWEFFKNVGYSYRYAGENLARDFSNPTSAVDAWMASPSHRDNMLSSKYQEIGVAVVEGDLNGVDTTIIVQLFGTPSGSAATVPIASAETDTPVQTETALIETDEPGEVTGTQVISRQSDSAILISPFSTSRAVAFFVIGSVIGVMTIDLFEIRRKGVQRVGGKTFAHFSFMIMVLTIVLFAQAGRIL